MRIDFNNKLSNLDEDEFHELVHAGGVPGDTVVPRMQGGHDLSKYQGLTYLGGPPLAYDKLLEACNPNK